MPVRYFLAASMFSPCALALMSRKRTLGELKPCIDALHASQKFT